jgi:ribosome biogenesis GTPase
MQGKIIKGISGFYYVRVPTSAETVAAGLYECKAKGIFRNQSKKPLVGDQVEIAILDQEKKKGNIEKIYPRENILKRPAVTNIDQALVFFALKYPNPSFNLLDRFLVMMERLNLPILLCFNKEDLVKEEDIIKIHEIYDPCGYPLFFCSAKDKKGLGKIRSKLIGKTSALAGPSGVGKSTFVNAIQENCIQEIGEISKKIKRGKNTTRHTQLIEIDVDSYIVDTPGFSSLGIYELEKEELTKYYPDFIPYEVECKFAGCAHTKEPICGIKKAVKDGKISETRYNNYLLLYNELKEKRKY